MVKEMANNQKPTLFQLYVEYLAERRKKKESGNENRYCSSTDRFLEMVANNLAANEEEILEN